MRVLTPCVLVSALAISACGGAPFTLETDDPSSAGSSSAGSSSSGSSSSGPSSSGSSSSGSSSSGSSSSEGGSSVSADAGADAVSDAGTYDGNPADLWDGNLDTDAEVPEIGVCNFPGIGDFVVCDQWCPNPPVGSWKGYIATFTCTNPGDSCFCWIVGSPAASIDPDASTDIYILPVDSMGFFVRLGEP